MRDFLTALALAAGVLLAVSAGCGKAPPPPAATHSAQQPASQKPSEPAAPRITQFYATAPQLARGEKELLCYGVENASTVELTPPPQELTASLTRCVEVTPAQTTSYTLTAKGAGGPAATQELTVTVGPPHVKIIGVTVSSLTVKPGDLVSICYRVENARSVTIDPLRFHGASNPKGCATDTPRKTTAYTITATGAEGSHDEEHVTVQVR